MKRKSLAAGIALAFSAAVPMSAQADVMIDMFSTLGFGSPVTGLLVDNIDDNNAAAGSVTGDPTTEVIGGVREFSVEDTTAQSGGTDTPAVGTSLTFVGGELNCGIGRELAGGLLAPLVESSLQ